MKPIDIRFPSSGMMLAVQSYIPESAPKGDKLPAIVVGHPVTGVKEQVPAIYDERLAKEGYIALTFDAAYQGDSEGAPRPLLVIAGTKADTLPFSEAGVKSGGDTTELFTIEGATHVDLYDCDPYVAQAFEKRVSLYDTTLA